MVLPAGRSTKPEEAIPTPGTVRVKVAAVEPAEGGAAAVVGFGGEVDAGDDREIHDVGPEGDVVIGERFAGEIEDVKLRVVKQAAST